MKITVEKSVSMNDLAVLRRSTLVSGFHRLDIDEFMRGFILTTRGDLQSKIDYTFRIYDQNDDNQISGDEIQKMAEVRLDDNERERHTERTGLFRYLFVYLGHHANAGRRGKKSR